MEFVNRGVPRLIRRNLILPWKMRENIGTTLEGFV